MSGKKISNSDIIGERGVAHVRKVVASMGYLFYETGGVEAGVDGFIEIRDPETNRVRNQTLQFQSKATTRRLPGDSETQFHFPCSDKDIDYWLSGTMPTILIVTDLEHDIAYWKDLRTWFKVPTNRSSKRVTFEKAEDVFDVSAAESIRAVSENGRAGSYYSPPRKQELLTPNLLRVSRLPNAIFWAPTEIRTAKQLWYLVRQHERYPDREVVLRENALLALFDLDNHPWKEVCDPGAQEEFDANEWALSEDPDRERNFVNLLNLALQQMLSRDLRYDPKHRTLYFKPRKGPKKRRFEYRADRRDSGRDVALPYFKKKDKSQLAYWRHSAFSWQFLRIGREWFIQVTPTYHYTRDGFHRDKFEADHLAGIKRQERNDAVRGQFVMWRELLISKSQDDLFGPAYPHLAFAPVEKLEADFGIDDKFWKASEGKSPETGPGFFG